MTRSRWRNYYDGWSSCLVFILRLPRIRKNDKDEIIISSTTPLGLPLKTIRGEFSSHPLHIASYRDIKKLQKKNTHHFELIQMLWAQQACTLKPLIWSSSLKLSGNFSCRHFDSASNYFYFSFPSFSVKLFKTDENYFLAANFPQKKRFSFSFQKFSSLKFKWKSFSTFSFHTKW